MPPRKRKITLEDISEQIVQLHTTVTETKTQLHEATVQLSDLNKRFKVMEEQLTDFGSEEKKGSVKHTLTTLSSQLSTVKVSLNDVSETVAKGAALQQQNPADAGPGPDEDTKKSKKKEKMITKFRESYCYSIVGVHPVSLVLFPTRPKRQGTQKTRRRLWAWI